MLKPNSTPREALRWVESTLRGTFESARAEAEQIVAEVLGRLDRTNLYVTGERRLTEEEAEQISNFVMRRLTFEPLQYILGTQNFFGIELSVGPGTLVPRPETEMLVETALTKVQKVEAPLVLEIGTGCGAIAIAIAKGAPSSRVVATEISMDAIRWAQQNAHNLALPNLQILEGDLFRPFDPAMRGLVDLVVSNPPYLSENEILELSPEVRDYEPRTATVSGPTGIEVSSAIIEESVNWLRPGGWLVIETSPVQWPGIYPLMTKYFDELECIPDLAGLDRIAAGRKS